MCGSMVDIQSAAAEENRRGKRKKKIVTTAAKYKGLPITVGGHNNICVFGKSAVCFQDFSAGLLPSKSRDKYRLSSLLNGTLMPTTSILYRVLEHKKLN